MQQNDNLSVKVTDTSLRVKIYVFLLVL